MTFNDENIDLNPNLSEVAKNIKSIQKFFSGIDYFYGDVEQAKKDYFKYMTWYLATPFMAYLRYFASRNNYDTKLFPMYGVIYGDSNGGKTTFIKFLVKLMCGETVKMNTTEDFTATRIDGLKRVCEGLPLNIDDLAKTQFQNHSERVIKNDEWGISDRLVNYPAVSITSNKITSLTKDLSKRAIICRIGAKIDNERGAKNSKRVNESMSELTTAFYGEYVRRMLVCIDEMTMKMRMARNTSRISSTLRLVSLQISSRHAESICRTMCVSCTITTIWVMRALVVLQLRKSNWHGRLTRASSGSIRSRTGSFTPIRRMDRGTN